MTQVVALQRMAGPQESAWNTELEKISDLSYFLCGPAPSELSAWACI
ncbi:hypothetical protein ACL02U_32440 [Streptomyces sp. MS06]